MKMGDRSCIVPSYSQGLSILLVDNDEKSLMSLSSMLEQFSYKVTKTGLATSALSIVGEKNDGFKLVIANVNMPDMDTLQFLHLLLEKDIPVILVSKKRSISEAKRAIAEGASFYLSEPIFPADLKYIWQHAYRNKRRESNRIEKPENREKIVLNNEEQKSQRVLEMSENTEIGQCMKRENEEKEGQNGKEKKVKITDDEQVNNSYAWRNGIFKEENKNGKSKKSRAVWTPELHLKFTEAISELGDKKARPKAILEIMNVPNLTARQVASHLQKYRCQVQRICENGNTNLPTDSKSSNSYISTKIFKNVDRYQTTPSPNYRINTGNLIDMVKACSDNYAPAVTSPFETNNKVSSIPSWKNQEMDCIALIKSLDDGNKKVEISNPNSANRDQVEKNVIEESNHIDLAGENIDNDDDSMDEWMTEFLNMDVDEIPNLDEIMESDSYENVVNVFKEDNIVGEPNTSDVGCYFDWIAQTLLGED